MLPRALRLVVFASIAVLLLTLSAVSGCKRSKTPPPRPTPSNRHGREITPLMTRVPTLVIPTPGPGVTLIPTLPG